MRIDVHVTLAEPGKEKLLLDALRDISEWNQVDTWEGGALNYPKKRAKVALALYAGEEP